MRIKTSQRFDMALALVVVAVVALAGYLILRHSHAASADINGDGTVNGADLSILAANFNKSGSFTFAQGDISGDGKVNIIDLTTLAINWGTGSGGGTTANSTTPCVHSAQPAQWKHVIVIMLENQTYNTVIGSSNAPYITGLAGKCATEKNWHDADFRVDGSTDGNYNSQPNYATLTSGVPPSTHGILVDNYGQTTSVDNIYNQLNIAGKSFKDYYDASGTGCGVRFSGDYHDPVRFYSDITSICSAHATSLSNFMTDLNAGNLPNFSVILPTNAENMHDNTTTAVPPGDNWTKAFLPPVLDSTQYKSGDTAIFLLWDEDTPTPDVLIAPSIVAGSTIPIPTGNPIGHFSAIRTWEDMLGLPLIGQTGQAPSLLNAYNGH